MVDRDRLHLGRSLATIGVAEEDRELVIEEFAVKFGQDRRTAGETCALLLATVGRRAPHSAAFWQYAQQDRGAAVAERVGIQERGQSKLLRSHPVGTNVSGEAGWKRETGQANQENA